MPKKKVVLNFAPHLIDQPITYRLTGDYGLVVNILRARITPNESGQMVLELSGKKGQLEEGLNFLAKMGVDVEPLAQRVKWLEERCIHCTACAAPCHAHALAVNHTDMTMSYDQERCIACDLCLNACPYGALEMSFE